MALKPLAVFGSIDPAKKFRSPAELFPSSLPEKKDRFTNEKAPRRTGALVV
jgi:hypothetical protein